VIDKLLRKLVGIGLVMTGVFVTREVWMFLADPPHGLDRGPAYLIGLFATVFVVGLIVIGGRLIVTRRSESFADEKKLSGYDEFF
jgi:hypothetical protein